MGEEGGRTGSGQRRGTPRGRRSGDGGERRGSRRDAYGDVGGNAHGISRGALQRLDRMEGPLVAAVVAADLCAAGRAFLAPDDLLAGVAAEEARDRHGRSRKDCDQRAKGDETAQHGRTITDPPARCQFKGAVGSYALSTYLPMSGFSFRRTSAGIRARSDQIASASADWQEQSVPSPAAAAGSARRMSASAFSVAARR